MTLPYIKLFVDASATVDLLSDAEAGRLLKALLHYGSGGDTNEPPGQEKLVFAMLKAQIDRDVASYQAFLDKQRKNGAKGGRPRKNGNPENPGLSENNPENPGLFLETQKSQEEDKDKEKEKDIDASAYSVSVSRACAREDAADDGRDEVLQAVREAGSAGFAKNESTVKQIRGLCTTYTPKWVRLAIVECVRYDAHSPAYLESVLKEWKKAGKPHPGKKPGAVRGGYVNPALDYCQREYEPESLYDRPAWLVEELAAEKAQAAQ